ncbi:mitotic check point protein bfa1 [Anaeramoeba ignava]|uniref:Mitotic check point protein bfa1 n=1 Tax=Anaeramoeba ignava TaxID=1746090 RepID=A0A9Q0R805_ANAIG|nr:mitotic check point protein bfa1 [Anaeramoeba ignava]
MTTENSLALELQQEIPLKRKVIDGEKWLKGAIDLSNVTKFKIHTIDEELLDGLEIPHDRPLIISLNKEDSEDLEIPENFRFLTFIEKQKLSQNNNNNKNNHNHNNNNNEDFDDDDDEDWDDFADQIESSKLINSAQKNFQNKLSLNSKQNGDFQEAIQININEKESQQSNQDKYPEQNKPSDNSLDNRDSLSDQQALDFEENPDSAFDSSHLLKKLTSHLSQSTSIYVPSLMDLDESQPENSNDEVQQPVPDKGWKGVEIPPNLSSLKPQTYHQEVNPETQWLVEESTTQNNSGMRARLRKFYQTYYNLLKKRPTITNLSTTIDLKKYQNMVFDADQMVWKGNERDLQIFEPPHLLRCLNKPNSSKVVGIMRYNPIKQIWEGNEKELRIFEETKRPGLITSLTPKKTLTIGEMVYDPNLEIWKGNEKCLSIFEPKKAPTLIPFDPNTNYRSSAFLNMKFNPQTNSWEKINSQTVNQNFKSNVQEKILFSSSSEDELSFDDFD